MPISAQIATTGTQRPTSQRKGSVHDRTDQGRLPHDAWGSCKALQGRSQDSHQVGSLQKADLHYNPRRTQPLLEIRGREVPGVHRRLMKGHTAGKLHGRVEIKPYVEIWEQPLYRWMISHAYHSWERRSRVIMRVLSKWHEYFFGRSIDYVPLTNRRDIRCYHLSQKDRKHLETIFITEEEYSAITRKKSSTQE